MAAWLTFTLYAAFSLAVKLGVFFVYWCWQQRRGNE